MKEYPKIQTVFKRDEKTHRVIEGEYSLPEFEYLRHNLWVFTEKVDGTNVRVLWNGKDITFGGKTNKAQMPPFLEDRLVDIFINKATIEVFKEIFGNDEGMEVCLYGEGYGARIQKGGGKYIPDGVDFILFDVKINEWWLERKNIEDVGQKLGIGVVPIIGEGTLIDLVGYGKLGFISKWDKSESQQEFMAEGVVAKPKVDLWNRRGDRIITKIKYKDFWRDRGVD